MNAPIPFADIEPWTQPSMWLEHAHYSQVTRTIKQPAAWAFDAIGAIALESGFDMTDEDNFTTDFEGYVRVDRDAIERHFSENGWPLTALYTPPTVVLNYYRRYFGQHFSAKTDDRLPLWSIMTVLNDHLRYSYGQIQAELEKVGL